MTGRILHTELWRGTAPFAMAVVAVGGTVMLFGRLADWGGRWSALSILLRTILIALVPIAVAAGAWQAGRDRRRRTGELLATVSRPVWHPRVIAWTAVTAGVVAGMLVMFGVGAAFVAPVASYAGGDWPLHLLIAAVALAAAAALGALVGVSVPSRLVPGLAGAAAYVGLGVLVYTDGPWQWLGPGLDGGSLSRLPVATHLGQLVLFGAVALAALVLAGGSRRWLAILPAVAAVAAATMLVRGATPTHWEPDPAARQLVCTPDRPEVCVTRAYTFLLDDVAVPSRALLARLDGVAGAPVGVAQAIPGTHGWRPPASPDGASSHLLVWLSNQVDVWGGLRDPEEVTEYAAREFLMGHECWQDDAPDEGWWTAGAVAQDWLVDGLIERRPLYDGAVAVAARLRALSDEEQRAWMGHYLAAAAACDDAARDALLALP